MKNCDLGLGQHFQDLGHSFSLYGPPSRQITYIYYMASSTGGQDDPNQALWLATRAGKMEPSCLLGTTRCIPQKKILESHIINPLLTKFVRSRWLDTGLVVFCEFMDLDFVSVQKPAKKELGQYPAILTSHLVNNQYILHNFMKDWGKLSHYLVMTSQLL